MSLLLCALLLAPRPATPALRLPPSPLDGSPMRAAVATRIDDGVVIPVAGGFLKIEVVAADVIRVAFAPDTAFFARKSLAAGDRAVVQTRWKVVRVGGGPALLVNPVTEYRARTRPVYLPRAAWYDFWTGRRLAGGRTVRASAPYERIPVYVRAGSIVPVGPELQYTDEKPADPITLIVYTGADGRFSLYEDDGASYGCERGEAARIPLRWDERSRTLIIGRREGSFPGMLASRTFQVVFVSRARPVGFSFDLTPDRTVSYAGDELRIQAPRRSR